MFKSFFEDAGQMIELGIPHLALVSCRNAIETLIKSYCRRIGVDTVGKEMNLEEAIKILHESGAINSRLNELLHRTRMICNKGAHADATVTMSDALEAYSYLKEIIKLRDSVHDESRLERIQMANNVPMKDPDYYASSRRYYGKWADCFDRRSLMVIPEYVELLGKANEGDVAAMLDIAVGFLPRNIIWNSNMLINTPSVVMKGRAYNHENSYDFRYYYWIIKAVQRAAYLFSEGQNYPKKYMATAIWEAALFSYYVHVSSDLNCRVSGVDEYFDPESRQYLYQELYSNQIDEMFEMFDCDCEESADLIFWHNIYDAVVALVKDYFESCEDSSIVAPIHTEGRANTYLKLRFIRYANVAYCTAKGDDSLRLSEEDAEDINSDYDLFRQIAPDVMAGRKNVRGGEAFSWEMLKPYTVGAFCSKQFVFGFNHAKADRIIKARTRSNNRILQAVFGM